MEPVLKRDHEVYTSYHQFYLTDVEADPQGDFWDGAGLERHLGVAEGMVAVGTIGYTFLPVTVEVYRTDPLQDFDDWDHVSEASLELRSGRLGLATVDGLDKRFDPIMLDAGDYRVRVAAAGLENADEMEGGDRYRIQIWPRPPSPPAVLRWWPAWDPAGRVPRPTVGGETILGAEATDMRVGMQWLASRGAAHLFSDAEGVLWEHSDLPDAAGTPQLERLEVDEAGRRYGDPISWGKPLVRPGLGTMVRSLWRTWRYSHGWRPPPEPSSSADPEMVDGRRMIRGDYSITAANAMTWVRSVGGDHLYEDPEGALWEYRNADAARGHPRLTELTGVEADAKFGISRPD